VKLALGCLGVLLVAVAPARADIFGNTFHSAEWGVELTAPRGWELTEQRSYPGIIARGFEHKSGARMLLAVARVGASETARSYAERNQKSLIKVGYHVTAVTAREGGAIVLDATTGDKKHIIRQACFVVGGVAYVLTVGVQATTAKGARPFEAFDEAMRTINITPPPAPPEKPGTVTEPLPSAPPPVPPPGPVTHPEKDPAK
jgi:hypothetical protein